MPSFYLADVRKRANPELSVQSQAIPERRAFPEDAPGVGESAALASLNYQAMLDQIGHDGAAIPDDPVACGLAGCSAITMEWTIGTSTGQIDFYATAPEGDEPELFLSLYLLSGLKPAEDRQAMKPLEQYADFAQCTQFPLVLHVIEEPLSAAWKHQALQKLRPGLTPLIAAFLKIYFPAEAPAPATSA
jgi:hypothetical protein